MSNAMQMMQSMGGMPDMMGGMPGQPGMPGAMGGMPGQPGMPGGFGQFPPGFNPMMMPPGMMPPGMMPPTASTGAADTRPPREKYAEQLKQIKEMGFNDEDAILQILESTGGNVQLALERLFM
jgi:hypothetical protein